MYIRGMIPRNLAELAEAVPIDLDINHVVAPNFCTMDFYIGIIGK